MDKMTYVRAQWDRVLAIVLVAVGLLLLLLGWLGVRDKAYPAEQIPYLVSGGLLGLFATGIGAMLWVSADLRDEWRKLDDLERAVRGEADDDAAASPVEPAPAVSAKAPARRSARRAPREASDA